MPVESEMKSIDLNALPYKFRSDGASLLISKANRLCQLTSVNTTSPGQKELVASLAYYKIALTLLKPYDPNFCTVVNWKCNVLLQLRQFEEAVSWYREIIRISDETDGKGMRNATARLAEEMISKYEGLANEPLEIKTGSEPDFDEPPFCMFAEDFCALLVDHNFRKAHALLSPELKLKFSLQKLKSDWKQMTQGMKSPDVAFSLEQTGMDWPNRKENEIGWCYFSVFSEDFNEALTVIVGQTPQNGYWITNVEFGRP